MTDIMEGHSLKGLKTLRTALLLSAPGPVFTGLSVIMSFSATQTADFLRRFTELAAIFAAWWIYRKLLKEKELEAARRGQLERLSSLLVGGSMVCTGAVMLIIAAFQVLSPKTGGNVILGLVIAVLGLLTNSIFWLRYRYLTQSRADVVLSAQRKLYRAKATVDLCVVSALAAVAIAPGHPVTKGIDLLGSVIVAFYLLWNGFGMIPSRGLHSH